MCKVAFAILEREKIQGLSQHFIKQAHSSLQLRWQLFDKEGHRFRKHLRPLFLQQDFSSQQETNAWLQTFKLIQQRFQKKQSRASVRFVRKCTLSKNITIRTKTLPMKNKLITIMPAV